MKKLRILLTIDSLFDVLYGATCAVNPEWGKLLESDEYLYRVHDRIDEVWPEIDHKAVIDLIKAGDVRVLQNSRGTGFVGLTMQIVLDNLKRVTGDPEKLEDISISVDLQHYQLSKEERVTLAGTLRELFSLKQIRLYTKGYAKLTPSFLKDNFDAVTIRNFDEWLSHHLYDLPKCPIPDVVMTAPINMIQGDIKDLRKNDIAGKAKSEFSAHLELDLINLDVFSMPPDSFSVEKDEP